MFFGGFRLYNSVSIPLGTINTKLLIVPEVGLQVSIPLGTINTQLFAFPVLYFYVSIPLGTINTGSTI